MVGVGEAGMQVDHKNKRKRVETEQDSRVTTKKEEANDDSDEDMIPV